MVHHRNTPRATPKQLERPFLLIHFSVVGNPRRYNGTQAGVTPTATLQQPSWQTRTLAAPVL